MHDILVHSVLVDQVDDGFGVRFAQATKQGHIQSSLSSLATPDQGRELIVIAYEYELVGKAEGPKARRKSDLGRLVDDAVVERPARKDGALRQALTSTKQRERLDSLVDRETSGSHNWGIEDHLFQFGDGSRGRTSGLSELSHVRMNLRRVRQLMFFDSAFMHHLINVAQSQDIKVRIE